MCISSFLQEEKTKIFYKHSSALIKPTMSAHFDGFDHLPWQKYKETIANVSNEGD